jgi:hypothetical protein
MLTHSQRGGMKPAEIARLLRLAINPQAKPQDRARAMSRLLDARERMSYDDLGQAVKKLTANCRRTQASLKKCLCELFSAS